MINNIEKSVFGGVVAFHIFWLFILNIVGEAIMYGHRYFDDTIRNFTLFEIIILIVSFIVIYKNKRISYIILGISLVSSYIVLLGHRFGIYECTYCNLH